VPAATAMRIKPGEIGHETSVRELLPAGAGLLMLAVTMFAHHGTQAAYQVDKTITLNGTSLCANWKRMLNF